jgi:hypothetical protein
LRRVETVTLLPAALMEREPVKQVGDAFSRLSPIVHAS